MGLAQYRDAARRRCHAAGNGFLCVLAGSMSISQIIVTEKKPRKRAQDQPKSAGATLLLFASRERVR